MALRLISNRIPSLARSFSSAANTTIADDSKYILGLYARYPVEFVRGQGSRLFDSSNRRYLDLSSGIAVNSLGHSDKEWQTTLATQASQLTHVSNLFYAKPAVSLAKKLVESSGFDKVFFCNSGTEANEAAFKFARKYAYDKHIKAGGKEGQNKKFKVIAFNGGFHGRSMGSLSLTYKNAYKLPFLPLIEGVSFLPFNDIQALKQAMNDSVCAVIVEPVQGEAGVFPASAEFLKEIRKLCNDHDALMICDEVQCGLGRLGVMWAHQAFGVVPDVVTLAKPLGNGLPIGAVLVKQKVADSLKPGDHGSTFAGNPLVTAVAGTVFDKLSEPKFLSDVRTNSKLLISKLKELQAKLEKENKDDEVKITAVRAHNDQGFLIGVDLNIPQKNVIKKGLSDHAVVLISGGDNTLRIAPPLTISADEIIEAVEILEKLFLGVKKTAYNDAK